MVVFYREEDLCLEFGAWKLGILHYMVRMKKSAEVHGRF